MQLVPNDRLTAQAARGAGRRVPDILDRDASRAGRRAVARMDRVHARISTLRRPRGGPTLAPTGPGQPPGEGAAARGDDLVAGRFLLAGHLVLRPGASIWEVPSPGDAFDRARHGFDWLPDLVAAGDAAAMRRARDWTHGWVARFGRGGGPGWTAATTGRRLWHWINHVAVLRRRAPAPVLAAFDRSVRQQTIFLRWRASAAPPGRPRIEALSALIRAVIATGGAGGAVGSASRALGRACDAWIDADGTAPGRNPEALAMALARLAITAADLQAAGHAPVRPHLAAMQRAAPVLRALRHADGGLARFHSGGRGAPGMVDRALALSGVRRTGARGTDDDGLAMGYARLAHGRTSIIVDVAAPPRHAAAGSAHASTLAFEMAADGYPLVVNCGSGRAFGDKWRRAGRATASHSTLAINGFSSARLGHSEPGDSERGRSERGPAERGRQDGLSAPLIDGPGEVRIEWRPAANGSGLICSHDGYVATHGLTHVRQLNLGDDGRSLAGEDILATIAPGHEAAFDAAMRRSGGDGIGLRLRFHLHPDVDALADPAAGAVVLVGPGGARWTFRHTGAAGLSLEPSVYLEPDATQPVATMQIVLATRAVDHATRITWTLVKADESTDTARDPGARA